jgi:hypothetical protein
LDEWYRALSPFLHVTMNRTSSHVWVLRKPKEACTFKDNYGECRKLDADIDEQ